MLTFISVNYNCYNVIDKLLQSVSEVISNCSQEIEFIVVDNFYSNDEFLRIKRLEHNYSFLKVIESKENLGFAKANNLGASIAKNEYLFFINPDCLLSSNLFEEVKCILNSGDESPFFFPLIDAGGNDVIFEFRFPFLSHFITRSDWRWYTGANLLVTKKVFHSIGGWPEDYFMYSEDTDLHYKLLLSGIKVSVANSKITHLGNASVSTVWNTLNRERRVFKSMMKFSMKYNKKIDFIIYYLLVSFSFFLKKPSYTYLRLKAMSNSKE